MKNISEIIGRYIGATPADVGCTCWTEMQSQMEEELNECIHQARAEVPSVEGMTFEEVWRLLLDVDKDCRIKKDKIITDYAVRNSKYQVGDVVTDNVGSIIVDKIGGYISNTFFDLKIQITYTGLVLKKDGTPLNKKIDRLVHETNIY